MIVLKLIISIYGCNKIKAIEPIEIKLSNKTNNDNMKNH